jgi:Mlc titration factor MtfA (ptsG expression regulator)
LTEQEERRLEHFLRTAPNLVILSDEERARMRRLVAEFLAAVEIRGEEGLVPSETERLLVAIACSTLYLGRPEWHFPPIQRVRLAPRGFDARFKPARGEKAWAGYCASDRGEVGLCSAALLHSFRKSGDGYQAGLHEFAHCLDFGRSWRSAALPRTRQNRSVDSPVPYGKYDGVPADLPAELLGNWRAAIQEEREAVAAQASPLGPYAQTNDAETFAVAVETFFERPETLRRAAPVLYDLLRDYFNQDPADRLRKARVGRRPPRRCR